MDNFKHTRDDAVEVPRGPLLAIAALVLGTLVAVGVTRWQSDGRSPTEPTAQVLAERLLQFSDRDDGGIEVRDARSGATVRTVASGAEPFMRGALRAVARERRARGLGAEPPLRLQAHADGRLALHDPATGVRIDLESFGPTQAMAFAQLLPRP
jgi:putative photosynthetic complex assembly protein